LGKEAILIGDRRSRASVFDTKTLAENLEKFKEEIRTEAEFMQRSATGVLLEALSKSAMNNSFDGLSVKAVRRKNKTSVLVKGLNQRGVNVFALLDRGVKGYVIRKPFAFEAYTPVSGITGNPNGYKTPLPEGQKRATLKSNTASERDSINIEIAFVGKESKAGGQDIMVAKMHTRLPVKQRVVLKATSRSVKSGKRKEGDSRLIFMAEGRIFPGIKPRGFYDDIAEAVSDALSISIRNKLRRYGFTISDKEVKLLGVYVEASSDSTAKAGGALGKRRYKVT
jgi:hypothetical protein